MIIQWWIWKTSQDLTNITITASLCLRGIIAWLRLWWSRVSLWFWIHSFSTRTRALLRLWWCVGLRGFIASLRLSRVHSVTTTRRAHNWMKAGSRMKSSWPRWLLRNPPAHLSLVFSVPVWGWQWVMESRASSLSLAPSSTPAHWRVMEARGTCPPYSSGRMEGEPSLEVRRARDEWQENLGESINQPTVGTEWTR